MVDDSKPEAPPLTEVTFKLSITEARNVAGLAGPGVPFSACVSTSVRGDVIETSIVPLAAEGGVHSFGHSHKLVFGLSPVRACGPEAHPRPRAPYSGASLCARAAGMRAFSHPSLPPPSPTRAPRVRSC